MGKKCQKLTGRVSFTALPHILQVRKPYLVPVVLLYRHFRFIYFIYLKFNFFLLNFFFFFSFRLFSFFCNIFSSIHLLYFSFKDVDFKICPFSLAQCKYCSATRFFRVQVRCIWHRPLLNSKQVWHFSRKLLGEVKFYKIEC